MRRAIVAAAVVVTLCSVLVQLAGAAAGVWEPSLLWLLFAPVAFAPALAVWARLGSSNERYRESPLTWTQDD